MIFFPPKTREFEVENFKSLHFSLQKSTKHLRTLSAPLSVNCPGG